MTNNILSIIQKYLLLQVCVTF